LTFCQILLSGVGIDSFNFPRPIWSKIIPTVSDICRKLLRELYAGNDWELFLDTNLPLSVSRLDNGLFDISLVNENGENKASSLIPTVRFDRLVLLDRLGSFVELSFHGFGGSSTRHAELRRMVLSDGVWDRGTLYYTIESKKCYSFRGISVKNSRVQHKLPALSARIYFLFRLAWSYDRGDNGINKNILLPITEKKRFDMTDALASIFHFAKSPNATVIRHLWITISNTMFTLTDLTKRITATPNVAEMAAHSAATHLERYGTTIVDGDEYIFEKYQAALGNFDTISQNFDKNEKISSLEMLKTLKMWFGPNASYFSEEQEKLCNAVVTIEDRHTFASIPCGGGKSMAFTLPLATVSRLGKKIGLTMVIVPNNFLVCHLEIKAKELLQKYFNNIDITSLNRNDVSSQLVPFKLSNSERLPDLIFLSIDVLATLLKNHLGLLQGLAANQKIFRFFVDEAHTIYGEQYRMVYESLPILASFKIPVIVMSGSLPFDLIDPLMCYLKLSISNNYDENNNVVDNNNNDIIVDINNNNNQVQSQDSSNIYDNIFANIDTTNYNSVLSGPVNNNNNNNNTVSAAVANTDNNNQVQSQSSSNIMDDIIASIDTTTYNSVLPSCRVNNSTNINIIKGPTNLPKKIIVEDLTKSDSDSDNPFQEFVTVQNSAGVVVHNPYKRQPKQNLQQQTGNNTRFNTASTNINVVDSINNNDNNNMNNNNNNSRDRKSYHLITCKNLLGQYPQGFRIKCRTTKNLLQTTIDQVRSVFASGDNTNNGNVNPIDNNTTMTSFYPTPFGLHIICNSRDLCTKLWDVLILSYNAVMVTSETPRDQQYEIANLWGNGNIDILISTTCALVGNESTRCHCIFVVGYLFNLMNVVQGMGRIRPNQRTSHGRIEIISEILSNNEIQRNIEIDEQLCKQLLAKKLVTQKSLQSYKKVGTLENYMQWANNNNKCRVISLSSHFGINTTQIPRCQVCDFCVNTPLARTATIAVEAVVTHITKKEIAMEILNRLEACCLICNKNTCAGEICVGYHCCYHCGLSTHQSKACRMKFEFILKQRGCYGCLELYNEEGTNWHGPKECRRIISVPINFSTMNV
jgi:hypothetical protein